MKKIIVLLLCLIGGSSLLAQENTVLGTGALSQTTTLKYAIQQIQVANPSGYSRPSIDFGGRTVQWAYQYMNVDRNGVYVEGYFTSTTDLGSFVPSIIGGYGSGATLNIYFSDFDGTNYYYEIYSDSQGSGYVPEVTLSSHANTNYDIYTYISEENELRIDYYDYNKTNLYTTAPTVSISFGGATATAILEGTAANGQNTAIGYQALYNSTASNNVGLGNKVGYELTTGKNNTFIGHYAGKGITTGSGNTILGATNTSLANNLSNSIILADGNGNNRMFFTPNGNALVGYGNTFTDNGYKLDVNGNVRAKGFLYAQDIDSYEAQAVAPNKIIEASMLYHKKLYQAPTSSAYHDILAFNKRGHNILFEKSSDKINFSTAALNTSFFEQKTGTNSHKDIVDGVNVKAVRWTWSGTMYSNAQWLALDYGYCPGAYVIVKLEHSSDNINWTVNHTSSYYLRGSSGFSRYHYFTPMDESNYVRLTITHNGGNTVKLSGIRLLTTRLGNTGAAIEDAYPYTWNKDGWIGINKGTTEPEYPLDVNGSSRFSGSLILNEPVTSIGSYDVLTRNTSTGAVEKLGVNLPTSGGFDLQGVTDRAAYTSNGREVYFKWANGLGDTYVGGNTNYARIGSSSGILAVNEGGGTVGINTTTPDTFYKLDVNGSVKASFARIENPSGGELFSIGQPYSYGSSKRLMFSSFPTDQNIEISGITDGIHYDQNIILQRYGGKVGVGTNIPTEKLEVGGNIRSHGGIYIGSNTAMNVNNQGAYVNWNDGTFSGATHIINQKGGGTGGFLFQESTLGNVRTNLMAITGEGNVGIGTTSPQEKLSVNGKIKAKEVKVQPTGWPDYVFEEGYKPLSLAEISTFVKQHKHLPEVPSAKEVEQNGLELGEMNKILLKKVEELTLHLIEKEKQLNALEERIVKLEKAKE